MLSCLTSLVLLLKERVDHVLGDGDSSLGVRAEKVLEAIAASEEKGSARREESSVIGAKPASTLPASTRGIHRLGGEGEEEGKQGGR